MNGLLHSTKSFVQHLSPLDLLVKLECYNSRKFSHRLIDLEKKVSSVLKRMCIN